MLGAVATKYVSAIYPFLLLFAAFLLVKLHDCNLKPVYLVLKPFQKVRSNLRKYIDVKQSLIHTFSALIVLSYYKFALVSYSLLCPTHLHDINGLKVSNYRWYYDAEVTLFSKQHLPYGMLAIAVFVLFIFPPPLLLLLYPFKWFRRLLHKVRLDCIGLHTFMDSFYGCYKDGTETNTRDLRCFAAMFFLLRLLFFGARFLLFNYYFQFNLIIFTFVTATIVFSYISPYKKKIYNIIDVCFLSLLSLLFFLYSIAYSSLNQDLINGIMVTLVLLGLIPLLYFVVLVMLQIALSVKAVKNFRRWRSNFLRQYQIQREIRRDSNPISEWPQRLLEYDEGILDTEYNSATY